MNFETRHILRWGIPGWYLIINIVSGIASVIGFDIFFNNQIIFQSVLITLLGVPLGFIIHQPYFLISNIFAKDKTIEWNLHLLQRKEDERKFLSERYGYLLTVFHGYGSLLSSIVISLLFVLVVSCINNEMNGYLFGLIIINIVLIIVVAMNYKYSQYNFSRFVNKVLSRKR